LHFGRQLEQAASIRRRRSLAVCQLMIVGDDETDMSTLVFSIFSASTASSAVMEVDTGLSVKLTLRDLDSAVSQTQQG